MPEGLDLIASTYQHPRVARKDHGVLLGLVKDNRSGDTLTLPESCGNCGFWELRTACEIMQQAYLG